MDEDEEDEEDKNAMKEKTMQRREKCIPHDGGLRKMLQLLQETPKFESRVWRLTVIGGTQTLIAMELRDGYYIYRILVN